MMSPLSTEQEPQEEASELCLDLDRNRKTPALARAAITGFSADRGISETTLATLNLLVSEIVTNAVIHPDVDHASRLRLYARIEPTHIHVHVTDQGAGFTPKPRDPAQFGGGYGLYLLEKASSSWGVDTSGGTTTVWFELTTNAP
jgi:anti-sigma regulatory factor (Ser/Thr protein kinase)